MQSINVGLAEAIRIEKMPRCAAFTLAGNQCRKHSEGTNGFCPVHDADRQCYGVYKNKRCAYTRPPDDSLCGRCAAIMDAI